MPMISLTDAEYEQAIKEAKDWVENEFGAKLPMYSARSLIETFLESLDSQDRDFSDKMLRARKLYKEALEEHDDECPSRLWEDALEAAEDEFR